DRLVLSANVHNYQDHAVQAKVRLALDDTATVRLAAMPGSYPEVAQEQAVEIASGGEKRVDWPVQVLREGAIRVKISAVAPGASDAVEQSFPVLVHGVERATAVNG